MQDELTIVPVNIKGHEMMLKFFIVGINKNVLIMVD